MRMRAISAAPGLVSWAADLVVVVDVDHDRGVFGAGVGRQVQIVVGCGKFDLEAGAVARHAVQACYTVVGHGHRLHYGEAQPSTLGTATGAVAAGEALEDA